ncbi:hypothetical protein PoB_002939400 [Plakobranchus ocellatus]|uniref:Uncharacterized protein n=1 Tax=Plakobranchus ocellatus TaxID=259542 RepID=A0AAV4A8U3_9GAST|nr:hypothetical protein PoB_002939400 [Plakobranchus ocellatus]
MQTDLCPTKVTTGTDSPRPRGYASPFPYGHSHMECDRDIVVINQKARVEMPDDWLRAFENNLNRDDESDIEVGLMNEDDTTSEYEEPGPSRQQIDLDDDPHSQEWGDVLSEVMDKLEPFNEVKGPIL